MLEKEWMRAAVFFTVALIIPVSIGAIQGDVEQGVLIGVVMGIIFGVMSQYFEPTVGD